MAGNRNAVHPVGKRRGLPCGCSRKEMLRASAHPRSHAYKLTENEVSAEENRQRFFRRPPFFLPADFLALLFGLDFFRLGAAFFAFRAFGALRAGAGLR